MIFSTEVKPKQPKANNATASTKGTEGAKCASVKELAYNVAHRVIVQTKPHRRFMETEPFSSLNRPPIKFNSFIRYLFFTAVNSGCSPRWFLGTTYIIYEIIF
jgi:hypothetical protein